MPATTEELRGKLKLEAHACLMISAKCRNRVFLQQLQMSHWDQFVEYLLGDRCYALQVPNSSGEKEALMPSWPILLNYEFELRKWALKESVRHGTPLGANLKLATENAELKELYFTGPVALSHSKRGTSKWLRPMGRFIFRLMGQSFFFMLIYADDLHLAAGGEKRWLTIWTVLAGLMMLGCPFSFKKFRGGLSLEWVGLWVDYVRFEIGISEKRSQWLIRFIVDLESSSWLVDTRRYQEFHGRLGFTSQVVGEEGHGDVGPTIGPVDAVLC